MAVHERPVMIGAIGTHESTRELWKYKQATFPIYRERQGEGRAEDSCPVEVRSLEDIVACGPRCHQPKRG